MTRLGFVKRAILAGPPRPWQVLAGVLLGAGAPAVMRLALQPLVGELAAFTTYFPFILLVAVLLGWRCGVAVTALSALFASGMSLDHGLGAPELTATLIFLASAGLTVATAETLRRTVIELDAATGREAALNAELQHRVKNNLMVVQGLAFQTLRNTPDPARFYESFRSRLHALSEAHDILSQGGWSACEMPELANRALKPFGEHGSIRLQGPRCALPAQSCVPLVLALHELGVNAVKCGALSAPGGRVHVAWRLTEGPPAGLMLRWTETGGPTVSPPERRGLGSRLLAPQPGLQSVTLQFAPEGVVCEIVVDGAQTLAPEAAGPLRPLGEALPGEQAAARA